MTTPTLRSRLLPALLLAAPLLSSACVEAGDDQTLPGELLFGLDESDVRRIHEAYLPNEDFELTLARLTAPFDCSLYGDLCGQVGVDAAIVLTERQVEQALAGVPIEAISAATQAEIAEASELRRATEAAQPDDELENMGFRATGDWAIREKGDYRLKVRNGASHPLIGDITAWTESTLQHRDFLGVWWAVDGTEICANTGANELEYAIINAPQYFLQESKDPAKTCAVGESSHERSTTHARLESTDGSVLNWRLTARGCGSGEVNGIFMGICAEDAVIGWQTW